VALTHSFWMIIDGAVPTAFRGREREDLLPTLHQLQRTQPGVRLVWFEAGRSWDSPEAAREARELRRRESRSRKPSWRPGGTHEDPREKYKLTRDAKRARFKKRATFDRQRSQGTEPTSGAPRSDRPYGGDRGQGDRPDNRNRQFSDRPSGKRPFKPFKRDDRRDDRSVGGEDRPMRSPKSSADRFRKSAGPGSGATSPSKPRAPWKPKGPWKPRSPWKPKGPRGPRGKS